jgi:hypothetical protein
MRPEPPVVLMAFDTASLTDGLTWDSGNESVHLSSPSGEVEGGKIAPYGSVAKKTFLDSCNQLRDGRDFPFHEQDAARASAQAGYRFMETQIEAGISGAERDVLNPSGKYSHIQSLLDGKIQQRQCDQMCRPRKPTAPMM